MKISGHCPCQKREEERELASQNERGVKFHTFPSCFKISLPWIKDQCVYANEGPAIIFEIQQRTRPLRQKPGFRQASLGKTFQLLNFFRATFDDFKPTARDVKFEF